MGEPTRPSAADLAVLDPDGSFVHRLRNDRDLLTRLATDLWAVSKSIRSERLAKIEELAHRLAGAAGTFGYAGVSAAALELESGVAARLAQMDRAAVEASLVGLRAAIETSLRDV
jgi:HPt (histidine-containing phosphotransfer) domain-containing protein